jgi:catechol 2,3-dioxygenase-like lactoylglutathione lyase family enzyme
MNLGAFSISLSVKDLGVSRAFYEKLGFAVIGGEAGQGWLVLRNPQEVTLGLFRGMFEGNLLTFNPGWNARCENVDPFDDVREIQRRLEAQGLALASRADAATSGPASLTLCRTPTATSS